jgi:4-hydroxybenzoate polyprenyltransferase/phosphoserine phosphatase
MVNLPTKVIAKSMSDRPPPTHEQLPAVPLVVDVDGTLLRTDLLYESFWAALGQHFLHTLWVTLKCWTSPARLKRQLLTIAIPDVELLPVRKAIQDIIQKAQNGGQPVVLVSGSDQSLVDKLAAKLGLHGEHFGSDGQTNLTGKNKASLLLKQFGAQKYDYAGNSNADLPAWQSARGIVAVAPGRWLMRHLSSFGKPLNIIEDGWGFRDLVEELRPHQWVKNLLLFFPVLFAHDFRPEKLFAVLMATIAFSIGASAIYIINDLLDLDADRRHPEKRNRPIASGRLPIRSAMAASAVLVLLALVFSYLVAPIIAALTTSYMLGSLVYSLWLKKLRWVDLLTLASLFMLRVLTGAAAADTSIESWLLAMIFAGFFTLACVKRITALSRAFKRGHLPGRGYGQADLARLKAAAYFGAVAAAGFFLIYAFSPQATQLYSSPWLLALSVAPATLWLVRIIRLSEHGKEDYDPVLFVIHDRLGLGIAALAAAMIILAA